MEATVIFGRIPCWTLDGTILKNKAFALNALRHTSGRDSFLYLMETVNTKWLSAEVQKALMTEKLPVDIQTMIKIYCYGMVRFTFEWLMDNTPLSHEEYADIMERSLPEPLRPFLYPKEEPQEIGIASNDAITSANALLFLQNTKKFCNGANV